MAAVSAALPPGGAWRTVIRGKTFAVVPGDRTVPVWELRGEEWVHAALCDDRVEVLLAWGSAAVRAERERLIRVAETTTVSGGAKDPEVMRLAILTRMRANP